MDRLNRFFIILCLPFFICGCKKEAKSSSQNAVSTINEQNAEKTEQSATALTVSLDAASAETLDNSIVEEVSYDNLPLPLDIFRTDAHSEYLNDSLMFKTVPDGGVSANRTAVVASRACKLYPSENFLNIGDNTYAIKDTRNMSGESIPFGTILEITGERLSGEFYGMFEFEDNYNYFYPVKWNGKTGYVFGSDLYGATNEAPLENQIAALLYNCNGVLKDFYPVVGFSPLSSNVKQSLENSMLAIQETAPQQTPNPDDMLCLYNTLPSLRIPVFLTTDVFSHSQHLIFDRLLQYTEENYFYPRLVSLTDNFIEALNANADVLPEHKEKAIMYFKVAEALLRTASKKVQSDDWEGTISYVEPNIEDILKEYQEIVVADVNNILKASGKVDSIFGAEEDFSQYKVRGHYTKNGILGSYFRTQMWYGRMHFLIAQSDYSKSTNELTEAMEPCALFIVDTVRKNPALYDEWAKVFDPITSLIGLCDDLSFSDVLPLWTQQKVADFTTWSSDATNLKNFMKLCHEKLRPPAIQGNSVLTGPSEGTPDNLRPPMGWRFLGQRFTWDSYIHDQITPPRLKGDSYDNTLILPSGLHILKVFGSTTAESWLKENQYQKIYGLQKALYNLQVQFASFDDVFWNQTYYNQVLNQIRTQAIFGQEAGFYFTQSPLWGIKTELSSLGTWAELRHDTILYVKQSYAELGGGDGPEPTSRIEKLPKPINYIEPNVPFFKCSLASIENLLRIYSTYDLLDRDAQNALEGLKEIYSKALSISQKEAKNEAISDAENEWITSVSRLLGKFVMVHSSGDIITDYDQLKMACIADVFTNAEMQVCLETAVGTPYKLFVPLNDKQGGKRIAVGFGFSYYEFSQGQSNRLTDEYWKSVVYKEGADLSAYMPDWEKAVVLKQ